jgi:hypothetical protein
VSKKSTTILECPWLPHGVFCVRPAVGNRTVTLLSTTLFLYGTEDSTGAIIRELG